MVQRMRLISIEQRSSSVLLQTQRGLLTFIPHRENFPKNIDMYRSNNKERGIKV